MVNNLAVNMSAAWKKSLQSLCPCGCSFKKCLYQLYILSQAKLKAPTAHIIHPAVALQH